MDYGASAAITAATCVISAVALLPQKHVLDQNVLVFGITYAGLTTAAYFFLSTVPDDESSREVDEGFVARMAPHAESISIRTFAMFTLLIMLTSTPVPKLKFLILVFAVLRVAQLFAVLSLVRWL